MLTKKTLNTLIQFQRNEITEYKVYRYLASKIRNSNKEVLKKIAKEELRHYNFFKKYTRRDVKPYSNRVNKYILIANTFGLKFGLKFMEKGEQSAQSNYSKLLKQVPKIKKIIKDEDEHEKKLLDVINEEKLKYIGSIVLGLNDALVELTGALAGFTLALQKTSLIAVAGLITGIAASLSMAGSEYLSTKAENRAKPLKSSLYTGFAYLTTVLILILPFFIFINPFISLALTILFAITIIFLFTYYVSVVNDLSLRKKFFEMAGISLSVAAISFIIGLLIRTFLNIEV